MMTLKKVLTYAETSQLLSHYWPGNGDHASGLLECNVSHCTRLNNDIIIIIKYIILNIFIPA